MKLYVLENDLLKVTFLDVGASIYSFSVKALDNRNIVLTTKTKTFIKNHRRMLILALLLGGLVAGLLTVNL
ncbi:MAG TPA: hypothetical protein PKO14_02900 [Bacilli bacterium]|nr:hypothetical protein [Bacilli bacterium]